MEVEGELDGVTDGFERRVLVGRNLLRRAYLRRNVDATVGMDVEIALPVGDELLDADIGGDGEELYVVESILDHEMHGHAIYFSTRWADGRVTTEPLESFVDDGLEDANTILLEYCAKFKIDLNMFLNVEHLDDDDEPFVPEHEFDEVDPWEQDDVAQVVAEPNPPEATDDFKKRFTQMLEKLYETARRLSSMDNYEAILGPDKPLYSGAKITLLQKLLLFAGWKLKGKSWSDINDILKDNLATLDKTELPKKLDTLKQLMIRKLSIVSSLCIVFCERKCVPHLDPIQKEKRMALKCSQCNGAVFKKSGNAYVPHELLYYSPIGAKLIWLYSEEVLSALLHAHSFRSVARGVVSDVWDGKNYSGIESGEPTFISSLDGIGTSTENRLFLTSRYSGPFNLGCVPSTPKPTEVRSPCADI